MRIILAKGLNLGWWLLALLTVGLAIVISTARLTLPMISDYRGNIEAQVSEIMQRPVHIGAISVGWDRLRPVMVLDDVLVRSKSDQRDAFHFEQLQLSFQMLRSVRELALVPHSIYLSGSELAITRTLDGGIVLRGLSGLKPTGNVTVGERLETLGNLALNLRDVRLVWHDQPLQQNWEFNTDELKVVFWQGGLTLEGALQLPPELGKTIDLVAVVRGDLKDYRLWNGDFYLRSDGVEMDALPALLTRDWPAIKGGLVTTETWGRWQGLDRLDLEGSIGLDGFKLVPQDSEDSAAPVMDLKKWSGDYRWRSLGHNWHLDVAKMKLETANRQWPGNGFSLDFERQEDAPGRLRGNFDFINLGDVSRLLEGLPVLPDEWRATIGQLQPSGEVQNIWIDIDTHTQQPRYQVDAELSQLSWLRRDRLPGLSGLDLSVSANESGGEALLSGPGFSFDHAHWFENALDFDLAQGELSWQQEGKGWAVFLEKLQLQNPDIRASGTAKISLSPDLPKPWMTLEMLVSEADVARVSHYLPYGIIPDNSEPWLREAFIAGRASNGLVQFDGELKKNALRYDDVLFRVNVEAERTQIHYRDGWPDVTNLSGNVEFRGAGFRADVSRGNIAGAQIKNARVGIDDLFLSRLKLDAEALGDVPQYLAFLQTSGIAKDELSEFIDGVESRGQAGLALSLDIPLTKKIDEEMSIAGEVNLLGAGLALPEQDLVFSDVQGRVDFSEHDFYASDLTAVFREASVTSSIRTMENRDVRIDVDGLFSIQELLPELDAPWMSLAPGASDWQARVTIPRREEKVSASLEMRSQLEGIAIALPDTLGKTAEQRRDFLLGWELGTSLPTVTIQYDDQIDIRALVNVENDRFQIERADVVVGGESARLQGEGIGIRGRISQLDVQDWAVVIDHMSSEESQEEGIELRQIDLDVDQLKAFGQRFPQVDVQAFNQADNWKIQLHSDQVAGEILWPDQWQSGHPIEAALDRLVVERATEATDLGGEEQELDPALMPSLRARIKDLHWGQASFATAVIEADRSAGDWLIQKAHFDSSIMSLQLAGAWLGNAELPATTRVQFKLEGRNVGSALKALEFSTGFGDGKGVVQGDVNWKGSPFDPDFSSLNGQASADIRDGTLKEVEPGLGRLLGLINLDKLPKRLSLNFEDVALQGLRYDTISGTGRFENGVLYVDGLGLDSPGAAVSIYGRTFMTSGRYDLNLNVVPKIKAALPLAAGLFVTPQTGFVVYFLDKMAEALGVDFNESALLAYRISGDWDNPNVERTTATADEVRENPLFDE